MAYGQGKSDEKVQEAHDEALRFRLANDDLINLDESIRSAAAEEAASIQDSESRVSLDENGLTTGMRQQAVNPVIRRLTNGWVPLRTAFLTSLQPYKDRIDAFEKLQEQIAEKEEEKQRVGEVLQASYEKDPNWSDARKDYQEAHDNHDRIKRAQGGRKAKQWPLWIYIVLLIGVGFTELLINYDTFLEFYGIQAFAIGTALVFAIFFAGAAHEMGSLLKQHRYFFGPNVEKRDKRWKLAATLFFHAFFIAALLAIGYFRYAMAIEELGAQSGPLSGDNGGTSMSVQVSASLIGNLLVYAVGALIAFLRHDPYPPLVDAEQTLVQARRKYDRLDKERREEHDQKVAELDRQIEEDRNTAEQNYKDVKRIARLKASVDEHHNQLINESRQRIDDNLQTYQYALVQALRRYRGVQIDYAGETIDLDSFASMQLSYPEDRVRKAIGN